MAAPPSKESSPSNQKMHQSDTAQLKDPPPSANVPTYQSSESSEAYKVAKELLNADNFEEALALIEEELLQTTAILKSILPEDELELHESLAPLHYLYGTTLLYSLEEAKESPPEQETSNIGAMMTEAAAKAATETSDSSNPWANLSSSAPESSETAEDIQIAWENLEASRTIVEKILLEETTLSQRSNQEIAKLQLDLAQIHLREGDLQRINGNYTSAIGDYSSCLEILLRHNQKPDGKGELRNLDRKIADTQFNLGLTYLTSSSDLHKELANASETEIDIAKTTQLAKEHCEQGIQQHVDCAKTFCGILAKICNVDPQTIWEISETTKPPAGFKTTGLEGYENTTSKAAMASQTLNVWRKVVANLTATLDMKEEEKFSKVLDIQQVLDEIQETIDEAERSQEGVRQAAAIKVQAQKAALGEVQQNQDGSTTTIGFGKDAPKAAVEAAPMMVVKKKKKRPDENENNPSQKRAKTE